MGIRFAMGIEGTCKDPVAVDEYLSEEATRDVYSVVLEGDPLHVNEAKITRLREG